MGVFSLPMKVLIVPLCSKHFPFSFLFKNWQHTWLRLRLFFTDKEINVARHFFDIYFLKRPECVCMCVWSWSCLSFIFSFWVSFFSPLGPQRSSHYYHCIFYPDSFSEKISAAGKERATAWALLIPRSPNKNSVQLLNMHLYDLLPTWTEFRKKNWSQQARTKELGNQVTFYTWWRLAEMEVAETPCRGIWRLLFFWGGSSASPCGVKV